MCIVLPSHSLFPPYTAQAREHINCFHILDNSDNLNSVHCLYLLFVYMYIYCFSYVLCSEGHMVE